MKDRQVSERKKKRLTLENIGMDKAGEFHLQLYSSSPAPKRDYHGLTISNSEVILNSWDITRGTHVYPRRKRMNLDDFLSDKWIRSEIEFLFGKHVIAYIDRLARKDGSIFCLSEKIVRKIIDCLAVNDILHLKQSSKIFFELCNTNEIWKILFRKIQKRPPTLTEIKQSELGLTWCHILETRIHDIHERKTIFQKYKKGVEDLHQYNHEIGNRIRVNTKAIANEKWKRNPPDPAKEKLLENKIKIPTYKNKSATKKVDEPNKIEKKHDLKVAPLVPKKRVESKKNIETINEMKKVLLNQKIVGKSDSSKSTTNLNSISKPTKVVKNYDNLNRKLI